MTSARRNSGRRGVTLIEVLMSTLIVSLVVVSASWAMSAASTSKHIRTEDPAVAAMLAREIHELAVGLSTSASGDPAATGFAGVTALDSLDGAGFSPPILATGEAAPVTPTWRQGVSVSVYDLADPTTPVFTNYAPIDPASGRIYRLSVAMTQRGAEMGTWWWWIKP
jgi:prepilin-type N-terminal cleavage/methylation domain-containing protein